MALSINEYIFLFFYVFRIAGTIYEIILSPSFFTSLLFSFCQKQQFNSKAELSRNSAPCFVSYHSITIKTLLLHSWILLPAAPFAIHSVGTIIFKCSMEVPLGFVRQEQCFTFHVEQKGCAKHVNSGGSEIFLSSFHQARQRTRGGVGSPGSGELGGRRGRKGSLCLPPPPQTLTRLAPTPLKSPEVFGLECAVDIWNVLGMYGISGDIILHHYCRLKLHSEGVVLNSVK